MKKLFQISLLFLFAASAFAQELSAPKEKVLRVYDWKDLSLPSTNCQIVSMDGMSVLKIENTNNTPAGRSFSGYPIYAPLAVSPFKITNSVIKKTYWVSCELKFENVWYGSVDDTNSVYGLENSHVIRQKGCDLKLVTYFPPSASGGDERIKTTDFNLAGTSNWTLYKFAVDRTNFESLPTELELKLSFAGHGTVYLRPIKLLGNADSSNWWTPEQSGLIGGIGGSIIGCFGALIGLLVSKGKARKLVLGLTKIFIVLGIFLLLAGSIAAVIKQPYAVYYPLLLAGFILTIVFSVNLPSIQRRYDELEIRRMTSVDTMGS
jgi:hypothetical protein